LLSEATTIIRLAYCAYGDGYEAPSEWVDLCRERDTARVGELLWGRGTLPV